MLRPSLSSVCSACLLFAPLVAACTPTNPATASEQPLDGPIAELEPAPSPAIAGGVSLGPVSAYVLPQYDSVFPTPEGGQAINLLIRLSADEDAEADQRPPLDLAIVLDRSGSMSGDKLRYAKQAGLDLLAHMNPRDRITLITYDNDVKTNSTRLEGTPAGIGTLRQELLDLSPGGTTALGPALFRALGILGEGDPLASPNVDAAGAYLSHVILLSDGLANVGEQNPQVIGEAAARGFGAGVSVSSLGMGLDYNEDLMTKVADEGGGRYHFIEDAEHIPAVLADELAGLSSTVASELGVDFDAHNQASVAKVYGYVSETTQAHTQVRVGYLSAGQERDIITRVELPASALQGQAGDELDLGLVTVRFRLVGSGGAAQASDSPLMELSLPVTVRLAGSAADAMASEHTQVTVRVAEVEAAAIMQAATSAVDRGDFVGAQDILEDADASYMIQLGNATSEAEKLKLEQEQAELQQAMGELEEAKHSVEKRKKYSKQYKASSYSKGKGSKKKAPAPPSGEGKSKVKKKK